MTTKLEQKMLADVERVMKKNGGDKLSPAGKKYLLWAYAYGVYEGIAAGYQCSITTLIRNYGICRKKEKKK